jgi:hypothetical protein
VVKNHLRVIYDKLGFWNRVELALWYEARRHESLFTSGASDSLPPTQPRAAEGGPGGRLSQN